MDQPTVVNKGDDLMDLPPGFRFHPTDEEIIIHYLTYKVINSSFTASAIGEVDLNKCEPWDLPKKAKMGEKEWYFFCQKDRKYPTGMRTNRATESGYWKATGKDKEIYKGKGSLVGMKKTLVFYRGRAPKGEKSNWVMHEYRLEGKFTHYSISKAAKDEWVVCRIFHKNSGMKRTPIPSGMARMSSLGDDLLDCSSLPPLMDIPGSSFTDGENEFKGISSSRSSDSNYLSYIPTNCTNYTIPNNSIFCPQIPIQTPISSFQQQPNSAYSSYSIPNFYSHGLGVNDHPILRAIAEKHDQIGTGKYCKLEQFSSTHSMISQSQETGISTDINTEISSVISKQRDIGTCDDHDQVPSVGAIEDLEYLWDY